MAVGFLARVTCNQCQKSALTDHGDFDVAVECGCCPQDHHHGQAANETGTPCRPVTIDILQLGAPLVLPVGE